MSEEQLSALLAKLSGASAFRNALKDSKDLEVLLELAKQAEINANQADSLISVSSRLWELSDESLNDVVAGGDGEVQFEKLLDELRREIDNMIRHGQSG